MDVKVLAGLHLALAKTDLKITDIAISPISNNIIVSYRITSDYFIACKQILQAIQSLDNHDYGLFIDAHNEGNYTLITNSYFNKVIHETDWNEVITYEDFEMVSNHLSIPKKLR